MKDILLPYIRITDIGKNIFNLLLENEIILDFSNIKDRNIIFLVSSLFRDNSNRPEILDFIEQGIKRNQLTFYNQRQDSLSFTFNNGLVNNVQETFPNKVLIDINICIEVLKIPSLSNLNEMDYNNPNNKWKLTLS